MPPCRSATSSASSERGRHATARRACASVRSAVDARHDRSRTPVRCADPAATAPWAATRGRRRTGDLICLWGELGAGKTHLAKAFGAGLGVDRDDHLAELHPDGRVPRPAAAVPHRPVSARRRHRRARRRAHRRPPGGRGHPRRMAGAAGRRAARARVSMSSSTGPATSRGTITLGRGRRAASGIWRRSG